MRNGFRYLFFGVAIIHLVACLMELQTLHDVTKPMLMILLAAYYFIASGENRSMVVLASLVFSLAGDVLLMNPSNFIIGLVAFLIAHLLYIVAYRQHTNVTDRQPLHGVQRVRMSFPIVLAGTGLVVVLFPRLGDLKVPVIFYAAVITFMVLTALFRLGKTNTRSFWLVLAGAILFMASDSILAINKFLSPVDSASFFVMLSYLGGQWLIVEGLVRHDEATGGV
jgi:uncharacterized membrane protein YhhN